jgi:hypothetical protein
MTHTYEIVQDFDTMSPRDDDTISRLVLSHNRFDFPNEDGYNFNDFSSWEELAAEIGKNSGTHITPVYMYDHSGIVIKASKNGNPFSCGWDSGQIGFVYTNADLVEYFGVAEEDVEGHLIDEVYMYSQYVSGDMYAYYIYDESGEVVESCGGYYEEEGAALGAETCGYIMEKSVA